MKLRTKFQDEDFELGEVVEANLFHGGASNVKIECKAKKGGYHTFYFDTLEELNEKFEDYEEPKKSFYLTAWGEVKEYSKEPFNLNHKLEIGNYFDTQKEAERAVEKLKARKRLKDAGFKPIYYVLDYKAKTAKIIFKANWLGSKAPEAKKLSDAFFLLFFGGEDE